MDRHHPQTATRILGLTGPIGCGKTTVGNLLLALGARARIDADEIVHGLMAPGTSVTTRIAATFGRQVLAQNGAVDRARLAELVFADPDRLSRLENIVHPEVRRVIRMRLEELADVGGIVIIDAVKLLQSDLLALTETVWVVNCDPSVQRERLTSNRGMRAADATARLSAQPLFHHPKVSRVFDNSASQEDLRYAVERAWHDFLQSPRSVQAHA